MPPPPPYPGLASFGDGDDAAELFFGRERERDLIIANLRAARLTVLYGPSGVGKSSLLHAGVVHRLRAEAREDDEDDEDEAATPRTAVVILDDWTGDPSARLAAEVGKLGGADREGAAVLDAVAAHSGGLLLILDQFEEYIRRFPDPREQPFDDVVTALARDGRASARILVAIREDRLANLDRFDGRVPQLLGNVLRLGPLSAAAALEAIEAPVERYAQWVREGRGGREVSLESGLALQVRDQLVALAPRRAGGAPSEDVVETTFLQLVMRRLWDEDVEGDGATTIRRATLARLGGAEEIVATHLDVALDRLTESQQSLAAGMLDRLVTPSGASTCLTTKDLAYYTGRPDSEVEALTETLARPPARVLRAVAPPASGDGAGGWEVPPVLAEPALDWRRRYVTSRLEGRARRLLLALVAMTAVATALAAYALDPGPLRRAELATVDQRFELRGTKAADPRVAIVTLDERTFESLKRDERLRARIAKGIEAIGGAAPRAVAVGVVFLGSEPDGTAALLRAIDGPAGRRLVLASDRVDAMGTAELLGAPGFGDGSTPAAGYDGFPADPGRVARRIRREAAIVPGKPTMRSLAVATARAARASGVADLPETAWIDYRGPAGTFPRVPLRDVIAGRPEALAKLRGKVVLLAEDAAGSSRTSTPGPATLDGAEIQANAISSALDGFPLRSAGSAIDIALIVALGLLPLGLALRLRLALVVPAALVAAAAYCLLVGVAFNNGRVVALVAPLLSLLLSTVGVMAVLLLRRRRGHGATPARRDTSPRRAARRPRASRG